MVMNFKGAEHIVRQYNGKEIPVFFEPIKDADGLCYNPDTINAKILVDSRLKKRRKLNVIIEEVFHAFFYDEPEYKARKFSAELGKIIYNRFIKEGAIDK